MKWQPPKGTYEALVALYGEVCGVCGNPRRKRRLHIDHDHATGLARGLLCFYCNFRVIGRHTLDKLRKAVAYLERHELQKQNALHRYSKPGKAAGGRKASRAGA